MSKRFRHRFNFSIYDDSFLDSEIIDYLAGHDSGHARQEAIRSLIRAGFSSLIKNNNSKQANIDSIDPSVLHAALQTLNNITNAGNQAHSSGQNNAQKNSFSQNDYQQNSADKEQSKVVNNNDEFNSEINVYKEKKFKPRIDESTNQDPESKDEYENRDLSGEIEDDDIDDPMALFSGDGGFL